MNLANRCQAQCLISSMILTLWLCANCLPSAVAAVQEKDLPFPVLERFESFGIADGLPTHKVHCVLPTSDGKLWVGTWKGIVVRENGKFTKIGVEQGLSHQMVVCMVEDPNRGDVWIGTMR